MLLIGGALALAGWAFWSSQSADRAALDLAKQAQDDARDARQRSPLEEVAQGVDAGISFWRSAFD